MLNARLSAGGIVARMSLDAPSLIATRMRMMRPSLVRELLKRATSPNIISFAGGLPNPKFFPNMSLIDASTDVLANDGGSVLQYAVSEGHPGLREWIAERYRVRFGLDVPVSNMLITTGSQQGIDLIGKVFIDPGDMIAIERPGYQGMLHALSVYQPQWAGVTLNEDGLDLAHLDRVLTESKAKLLMVCPNYQNPSGITYTEANRAAVAEIVKRHNVMLVEDDPYSELGFGGKSPTSFRKFLPEQCIALGSFSKLVAPGMRIGWLIAPNSVYERFVIAKQGTDFHTSNFAQRVLHSYLKATDINEHVALIQNGYATQCAAMLKAIDRYFPAGTHITRPDGGMFIWMTLPDEVDSVKLLDEAIDAGVTFLPGPTFYTDGGGKNQLRLSYSQSDEDKIDEGIQRLAAVVMRHLDAAE
jgi:2-aminoadipate transaminase